jgi:hypothetical protein
LCYSHNGYNSNNNSDANIIKNIEPILKLILNYGNVFMTNASNYKSFQFYNENHFYYLTVSTMKQQILILIMKII